jgi:hypothetical protein
MKYYEIILFGVKIEEQTIDAVTFYKAIDEVSANKVGKEDLLSGNYASDKIFMQSNVGLYRSPSTKLLGNFSCKRDGPE